MPTLPLDTQAASLEERNLEVFGEWRLWDDDHDGIINAEEVDTWWKEGFKMFVLKLLGCVQRLHRIPEQ